MPALKVSVPTADIASRMSHRLRGGGDPLKPNVVWRSGKYQLLVFSQSVKVKSVDGWLVANVDVQSDQTGNATLQFLFFLGRQHDGDGVGASARINAPSLAAAQIADAWGGDLQRVLWDALVDALEGAVEIVAQQGVKGRLVLSGFRCDGAAVHVNVLLGVS